MNRSGIWSVRIAWAPVAAPSALTWLFVIVGAVAACLSFVRE